MLTHTCQPTEGKMVKSAYFYFFPEHAPFFCGIHTLYERQFALDAAHRQHKYLEHELTDSTLFSDHSDLFSNTAAVDFTFLRNLP